MLQQVELLILVNDFLGQPKTIERLAPQTENGLRLHLASLGDEPQASDRLCELNVLEQVANVCQTTIARDAWQRGQGLAVHGWIYGLQDGLLRDLNVTVEGFEESVAVYQAAISGLAKRSRA